MVDYNNPALGSQHTGLFNLEKEFVSEFAPAAPSASCMRWRCSTSRTHPGGNLDNAIVIVDRELAPDEITGFRENWGSGNPSFSETTAC